MKKFYFLPLLLISILTIGLARAQEKITLGTINGAVLDELEKPVDYATIGLFKTSDSTLVKTTLTAPDGKFQFLGVKTGDYYLKVNMMGFAPYKGKAFNLGDEKITLDLAKINLQSQGKTLKAVSITAVKPLIERRTDKVVMNVENSSVAIGSTALEVLQRAPGINFIRR